MSEAALLALVVALEVAIVGVTMLVQPFVMRRGLVFGVYVGERDADGDEARAIRRGWLAAMAATLAGAAGLGGLMLALRWGPPPLAALLSVIVLVAGSYGAYLRAYLRARPLAATGAPAAAATLAGDLRPSLALPLASLAVALAGGLAAIAYAWMNYSSLPPRVPTHFGPTGRPDAWSPRSFSSVMLLPLATLLIATAMAVVACLIAGAKRAIRRGDGGVSLAAQQRFRQVSANYMALVVIVMTGMMTLMSIYAVRTGLGLAAGMPPALIAVVIVLLVLAVGGGLYIALRYGQGGARLERSVASAPLTNGLADNSRWRLGVFYVNRDDPSLFVEKRFGIGYTINFGNPKAVALFVAFLAVIAYVVISGIMMQQ